MTEEEKIVTLDNLSEEWMKKSLFSFENIKEHIKYYNNLYGFDLMNKDEDLEEELLNKKLAIKEIELTLSLTYMMELFVKAVIIYYNKDIDISRDSIVYKILNDVKKNIKGKNFHDIEMYINYINNCIDDNYINLLGRIYSSRRIGFKRGNHNSSNLCSRERINKATKEFQNAFIDFRYLYEKSDNISSIDLSKLIDYISSVRDTSLYLIEMKKYIDIRKKIDSNFNIEEYKNKIKYLYQYDIENYIDMFNGVNILNYIFLNDDIDKKNKDIIDLKNEVNNIKNSLNQSYRLEEKEIKEKKKEL